MIKNYLLIAYRNLLKNKVFSLINILGLAMGMAACLLILQYVSFELSYDDFHEQADRVYRVRFDRIYPDRLDKSAGLTAGAGPALKEEFPEVQEYTKLWHMFGNTLLSYQDRTFQQEKLYYADKHFFDLFSYPFIKGDAATALAEANTIVLTTSLAEQYFGEEDPMGKFVQLANNYGRQDYLVTGVVADPPQNTHFKFEALASFQTLVNLTQGEAHSTWRWNAFLTYLLLTPDTDANALEAKLPAFVEKYYGPLRAEQELDVALYLQLLTDIHLYSDLRFEAEANGNGDTVYFLAIIAFFILLIAWVNYINLSTAKSMERAREVGIRKVAGARRWQLIKQYLLESFLLNLIGAVIAFTTVQVSLPFFRELTGRELSLEWWNNYAFWLAILGFLCIGTLLSGIYPALILSVHRPIEVLKGKLSHHSKGGRLRKALVVFQYGMSVILMAGTLIVYQQLRYMQNEDLGFELDQTLVIDGPGIRDSTYWSQWEGFRNNVSQEAQVYQVTSSSTVPGEEITWVNNSVKGEGSEPTAQVSSHFAAIDQDFLSTFGMKLMAGRNFSEEFGTERKSILLNESAVRLLGFASAEESIDKQVYYNDDTMRVVGVVANYHQRSLNHEYYPIVYEYGPGTPGYYSLKVNTQNLPETIASIEQEWQASFSGNPFNYFFLDDSFNRQYRADRQFASVFGLFAGLAILIACLGLYGLSAYTALQRTKEIAVRKVLGASVPSLLALLSRSFIKLVLLAGAIALPIAYVSMQRWLSDYAFRIEIGGWLLLAPIAVILLIALLTISFQTFRAASANPVKSLRYE